MGKNTFIYGTKNPAKIEALCLLVPEFTCLHGADIQTLDAPSRVSKQPMTLEEIRLGAFNRASYLSTDQRGNDAYGVGVESGIAHCGKDVWIDITVACITAGDTPHYGMSFGFVVPDDIMTHIHQGLELSDAAKAAGYTSKERIGNEEGIIGVLTGGRLPRVEQLKSALRMALFDLERAMGK